MFKNDKGISTILFLAILGMLIFQGIWLKQNYDQAKSRLVQDAYNVLDKTLASYYKERALTSQTIGEFAPSSSMVITSSNNDMDLSSVQHFMDSMNLKPGDLMDDASVLITIESDSSVLVDSDNMSKASVFPNIVDMVPRLLNEVLNTQLDTALLHELFDQERGKSPLEANLSLVHDSIQKEAHIYTRSITLSPAKSHNFKVAIDTYALGIIENMWGIIAGSFFIVFLVFISFGLMMRRLLKEKRINQVKNDFINNMTHELKTPLATISASVEAMTNFGALEDPEKTAKYLKMMNKEVVRLSGMVDQVLNAAVNEHERIELDKSAMNLHTLLVDLESRYQLGASKPLVINLDVPENTIILADSDHFPNMINNLIDNAIKYSADTADVTIEYQLKNNQHQLRITDKGIGIKPQDLNLVFDKFYRVSTGDTHDVKGFGLGLNYVKKMVDLHGWDIQVTSKLNVGTTFTLIIPQHG